MSTTPPQSSTPPPSSTPPQSSDRSPATRARPWATSFALFAGVLMLVAGVYHALGGIAAILGDELYLTTPGYVYGFDLTGWGWLHLVLGVLVAVAGVGVVSRQLWARIVGITLASLSLIVNFMFIPYYPLWSVVIMALDIVIIWALTVYDRD